VLRNRAKLRLKVRALTSEGRLSGVFLSVMPFILILVVNLISPGYFSEVKDHPLVGPAVLGGFLLLAIGNYTIYRMVNFKF
jgi:tight adherence protein B